MVLQYKVDKPDDNEESCTWTLREGGSRELLIELGKEDKSVHAPNPDTDAEESDPKESLTKKERLNLRIHSEYVDSSHLDVLELWCVSATGLDVDGAHV